MQGLMFLDFFVQKLSKKNIRGSARRKRLSVKNNGVSMDENRKSDFQIQTNRSFDLSDFI